jgi:hypothetical protein
MRKYASDMLSLAVEENMLTKLLELAGEPYSSLHWAARNGYVSVIEALMNSGADAAAADCCGNIPLMIAAAQGHDKCVKSLLTKTPQLQVKALTRDGANALLVGIAANKLDCVRRLLEHYPSEQMNVIYRKRSLLECALDHQDIFEELLKHEWPHNILDKTLQATCSRVHEDEGFRKNIQLLLGRGALLPAKGPTERDRSVVRTALRELVLSATLPDRLNEAVLGVALHKRQRIA